MRVSWPGLLFAPLLVPVLASLVLASLVLLTLSGDTRYLPLGFLILLVPGCIVSYSATFGMLLPCLWLLSRVRRPGLWHITILGFVLGFVAMLPWSWVAWGGSGPDSGPPVEPFLVFLVHWVVDPVMLSFPFAGAITAATYWYIARRWPFFRRG